MTKKDQQRPLRELQALMSSALPAHQNRLSHPAPEPKAPPLPQTWNGLSVLPPPPNPTVIPPFYGPARRLSMNIRGKKQSYAFHEPVSLDLFPDYNTIIQKPMDMLFIYRKFEAQIYQTLDEFASDFCLIFDNAEKYHRETTNKTEDSSEMAESAKYLRSFFEQEFNKIRQKYSQVLKPRQQQSHKRKQPSTTSTSPTITTSTSPTTTTTTSPTSSSPSPPPKRTFSSSRSKDTNDSNKNNNNASISDRSRTKLLTSPHSPVTANCHPPKTPTVLKPAPIQSTIAAATTTATTTTTTTAAEESKPKTALSSSTATPATSKPSTTTTATKATSSTTTTTAATVSAKPTPTSKPQSSNSSSVNSQPTTAPTTPKTATPTTPKIAPTNSIQPRDDDSTSSSSSASDSPPPSRSAIAPPPSSRTRQTTTTATATATAQQQQPALQSAAAPRAKPRARKTPGALASFSTTPAGAFSIDSSIHPVSRSIIPALDTCALCGNVHPRAEMRPAPTGPSSFDAMWCLACINSQKS